MANLRENGNRVKKKLQSHKQLQKHFGVKVKDWNLLQVEYSLSVSEKQHGKADNMAITY